MSSTILKDPFYIEGYNDYNLGYDISDCPYCEGTDGEYGWKKGYMAANKEFLCKNT